MVASRTLIRAEAAMDGDLSNTRSLKKRWDEEDAVREERERQAKELFLEQQGDEIFAPIERCLIRLDNVLRKFGGSVEIDSTWEHLGDQRLRRVAKVRSIQADQKLTLDFNVHGVRIFHRDKSYQLSRDMGTLIRAILGEVEQFLTTSRQQAQTGHSQTEASSLAPLVAPNIGAANG
jgi:hypothetical protein